MLKEMLASSTAKLVAACVCPVVGAAALTVASPKVRSAVHDMTAPKRTAKAKPRVRVPVRPVMGKAGAGIVCPQPIPFAGGPAAAPTDFDTLGEALAATAAGTSGSGMASLNRAGGSGGIGSSAPGGFGGPGRFGSPEDGGVDPAPEEEATGPGDGGKGNGLTPVAVVPEPETWLQMLLGFGVLGGLLRLRHRKPAGPRSAARR
jgi:hypothetical protein